MSKVQSNNNYVYMSKHYSSNIQNHIPQSITEIILSLNNLKSLFNAIEYKEIAMIFQFIGDSDISDKKIF